MRHTLKTLAMAGILAIGGLLSLSASPAQAQAYGGYPGGYGYGGGYPATGYYGQSYAPAYPTYQQRGNFGGYAPSYYNRGYVAPSYGYQHHHRHHRGCGHHGW